MVSPETFLMDGPNAGALVRASDGKWFSGGWIRGGRVGRYHADRSYDAPSWASARHHGGAGNDAPAGVRELGRGRSGGRASGGSDASGRTARDLDHDGVRIAKAAVPDPFQPAWAQGRSRGGKAVMAVGPETRYGFTDLAATQRYCTASSRGGEWMRTGPSGRHARCRSTRGTAPT